jgi:hypothetical protein
MIPKFKVVEKQGGWFYLLAWVVAQVCLGHNLSALVSDSDTCTPASADEWGDMWLSGNCRYCDYSMYVSCIATLVDWIPEVRNLTHSHPMSHFV